MSESKDILPLTCYRMKKAPIDYTWSKGAYTRFHLNFLLLQPITGQYGNASESILLRTASKWSSCNPFSRNFQQMFLSLSEPDCTTFFINAFMGTLHFCLTHYNIVVNLIQRIFWKKSFNQTCHLFINNIIYQFIKGFLKHLSVYTSFTAGKKLPLSYKQK